MPLNQKELGERLRQARVQVQMTQEEAAKASGMERSILAKIESGSRSVSGLELDRLARLYRRDVSDLLSEVPLDDDPLLVLGRTVDASFLNSEDVLKVIELIREASQIEHLIGEPVWSKPPGYAFCEPRSFREADEQGKEMAKLERQRLKLGFGPISDMADLIAAQGIWAAAFPLPPEVSGLFMWNEDCGPTILVNCDNAMGRRRFSYAHEYAHALADRHRAPTASTADNSKDLIERRANVFASEFLVPLAGVHECLDRFRKGHKSRINSSFWDAANNKGENVEDRVTPGSQRITALEAHYIASEYRVSYDMAVFRLKHAGAIKEPEIEELRSQKSFGEFLIREFKFWSIEDESQNSRQPHLKMQVARLLVEAYRRGSIYSSRFREVCDLADIPFEELYPVAKHAKSSLEVD